MHARPRAARPGPRPRPVGRPSTWATAWSTPPPGCARCSSRSTADHLDVPGAADAVAGRHGRPGRPGRPRRSRPGSCTCRCRGTTPPPGRPSSATCTACGPTRRGARGTSSSSGASTGSDTVDDVHRIVFDAVVPGARPRRRLPRRAGGHAARPPPPAGDHQVQPGPHLDAGERGRHRRRLPVHLRDGGARRLPVRRPHGAGVEPGRAAARTSTEPWLLRTFDQIRWYPVGAEELLDLRAEQAAGALALAGRGRPTFRAGGAPDASWPSTATPSRTFRDRQQAAFDGRATGLGRGR